MKESKQRHANECVHSAPFWCGGRKKAGVKHHGTGCICVSSPPTGEVTHIQLQLNHLLYSSRPELYHGCQSIFILMLVKA